MFRTLRTLEFFTVLAMAVAVGFVISNVSTNLRWKAVYQTEYVQRQIAKAQDYSRPLASAMAKTTEVNLELVERERAAAKIVSGLQEESRRLKASLREAVENLKLLTEQNNELMDSNEKYMRRISELEAVVADLRTALKALQTEPVAPPVTPPAPPYKEEK